MFPYPLQGHVIPFTNLAIKLASNGFTITFINTESIHHQISKANGRPVDQDLFSEARKSGLDIRYATVSDGFPVGFDRSLNHDEFFEGILHDFWAHVDKIVGVWCTARSIA
ncbi:UNVERIFIED_CONTAM: UDP-glycosyltransferase 86A1 [Sesamum angustifolium]|uniref:UDP-glycosyltransferase 86A1 n=1 Tax=Sesamum angustifolium TaxID=2727405 RepID=A0AAW2MS64_9LAMI